MIVYFIKLTAALTRLKNCLPRSALDALYGVAELTQTPEFEVRSEILVTTFRMFEDLLII